MGLGPHRLSPSELSARLTAERRGVPFLAYRDGGGDLRLTPLEDVERITIGRLEQNDLVLDWDPQVSRAHAQLEFLGGDWTVIDRGSRATARS